MAKGRDASLPPLFSRQTRPSGMSSEDWQTLRARWELSRRHPSYFLRWFAHTCDQHDPLEPVKPFPWNKPHIVALTDLWMREPRLVIAKSRQMICTWLFSALYLWDTMFNEGRLNMLQSKREEDAIGDEASGDGLLGRAKFILNNIPSPARELLVPKHKMKANRLVFPLQNSTLWAIPQGADIIRQRTASGILSDEAGFQPEFADAFMAATPCVKGGGRFTILSTANPGYFEWLYRDMLDDYD